MLNSKVDVDAIARPFDFLSVDIIVLERRQKSSSQPSAVHFFHLAIQDAELLVPIFLCFVRYSCADIRF